MFRTVTFKACFNVFVIFEGGYCVLLETIREAAGLAGDFGDRDELPRKSLLPVNFETQYSVRTLDALYCLRLSDQVHGREPRHEDHLPVRPDVPGARAATLGSHRTSGDRWVGGGTSKLSQPWLGNTRVLQIMEILDFS